MKHYTSAIDHSSPHPPSDTAMLDTILRTAFLRRSPASTSASRTTIVAVEPASLQAPPRPSTPPGRAFARSSSTPTSHGRDALPTAFRGESVRGRCSKASRCGAEPALADPGGTGRTGAAYCDWAVAKGLLKIRSYRTSGDPRLLAVEALLEVRKRVAPHLDLQLVAFHRICLKARVPDNLKRAGHGTTSSAAFRTSSAPG